MTSYLPTQTAREQIFGKTELAIQLNGLNIVDGYSAEAEDPKIVKPMRKVTWVQSISLVF